MQLPTLFFRSLLLACITLPILNFTARYPLFPISLHPIGNSSTLSNLPPPSPPPPAAPPVSIIPSPTQPPRPSWFGKCPPPPPPVVVVVTPQAVVASPPIPVIPMVAGRTRAVAVAIVVFFFLTPPLARFLPFVVLYVFPNATLAAWLFFCLTVSYQTYHPSDP